MSCTLPLARQFVVFAVVPHTEGMNMNPSWEGYALSNPPAGGGVGNPGFPIPLLEGCARTLPRAGVWGTLGSPHPLQRTLFRGENGRAAKACIICAIPA